MVLHIYATLLAFLFPRAGFEAAGFEVRFEVDAWGWHHVAVFNARKRVRMAVGLNQQAWSNAGSGRKGQWHVLYVWSKMRYGEEGGGLRCCSGEGVLVL